MIRWLGIGAESDTPRSGPLSSIAEWHALLTGFFVGVLATQLSPRLRGWLLATATTVSLTNVPSGNKHRTDVANETTYTLCGLCCGFWYGKRNNTDE